MGRHHDACYAGDVETVRELLADGADPNERDPDQKWVSSASSLGGPTPLSCVAIAWRLTGHHVEIMRLLIEHGAEVETAVFRDLIAEATGSAEDTECLQLLLRHASAEISKAFAGPPPWDRGQEKG